jgi:hypothetical protein
MIVKTESGYINLTHVTKVHVWHARYPNLPDGRREANVLMTDGKEVRLIEKDAERIEMLMEQMALRDIQAFTEPIEREKAAIQACEEFRKRRHSSSE